MKSMSNQAPLPLFFEFGISQLIKHGEELCGDSIVSIPDVDAATLILSDGLGSGVKANILATLTTRIISVMIQKGCALDDVVHTLTETLPTCSVRKLAYSTFSVGQLDRGGKLRLVEYDNPPAILLHNNRVVKIDYQVQTIDDKKIKEAEVPIEKGDWLIFISDGEVHAGIGGVWNLGWSWDRIARFIETRINEKMTAAELAAELTGVANKLYGEKPGDDTSVAVVKVRYKNVATVMVGAPKSIQDDDRVVKRLMEAPGRKVVCGGTTGNIVSRVLQCPIKVDLRTLTDKIPPIGYLEGIDLCTEGIFTISRVLKMMKEGTSLKDLYYRLEGASMLLKELYQADDITFLIGQAMNPAHQNPNMPPEFELKTQIMEEIGNRLSQTGKTVAFEYF